MDSSSASLDSEPAGDDLPEDNESITGRSSKVLIPVPDVRALPFVSDVALSKLESVGSELIPGVLSVVL